MSSPPSSEAPPYYVLVSQAAPPAGSQSVGGVYKSFSHPIIQYHYADDHPHALLPQSPNEHVLVLDYDHSDLALPVAQSLSTELAVVGVRVTDAPATATATEDNTAFRNNKMYVIETTAVPPEMCVILSRLYDFTPTRAQR